MKNNNKNIYFLTGLNCLNNVYNIFFGMFMISFLFKQAQKNIVDISFFQISCYFIVGLMAYLTGNWVKRGNRMLMYKIGIISTFIFFTSFLLLQEKIINYILLYGALFGLITAFKAFPFNLIVADSIDATKMIAFKGYLESLNMIVRVVSPVLLGYFFATDSYFNTIAFFVFLSLIEFVLACYVEAPAQKDAPKMNIKKFWQAAKQLKFLHYLYKTEFYRGITLAGALATLITVYTVYLFHTDFNLGLINSIFFGITVVLNFLFGRYCQYRHFIYILTTTAVFVVSSVVIFVLFPNKATFIFYNFCFVVINQFLNTIMDINLYNVSNLPEVSEHKNEYFIARELFLGLGRILSYGFLLIIGLFNNYDLLKYLLLFLTLFMTFMSISSIKLNKYFLRSDKHI